MPRFSITLSFIIFFGTIIRVSGLNSFPSGLHGDEAWTGIRAKTILDQGWIGFYDSVHSIGQWALPGYLTAPFVALIKDPILSVRLPMAILGSLSVLFFALFLLNTLGKTPAILGTLLLTIFPAHVLLSRVAFPPIVGTFFIVIALWVLSVSIIENRSKQLFFFTGVLFGLALISYGATPAFVFSFLLGCTILPSSLGLTAKDRFKKIFIVTIGLSVVLIPVFWTEWNSNSLFLRGRSVIGKSEYNWERFWLMFYGLFHNPHGDFTDGLGVKKILDYFFLALILLGGAVALKPLKSPTTVDLRLPLFFSLILSFIICLYGSVNLTFGFYRRLLPTLLIAIWFCSFALYQAKKLWIKLLISLTFLCAIYCQGLYLIEHTKSDFVRWVYCDDLTKASLLARMIKEKDLTFIFSSKRWSGNYETSRYLSELREKNWKLENISTIEELNGIVSSKKRAVGVFFPERFEVIHKDLLKSCVEFGSFKFCNWLNHQ